MEQVMNQYYIGVDSYGEPYIAHWGIKGQKWGIRRFQNPDGSLTEAGRERYRVNSQKQQPKIQKIMNEAQYNDDPSNTVFGMLKADKKYLQQADAIAREDAAVQKQVTKEVDNMFKDLRSSENIHIYEAASELASWAQYRRQNVDDMTLEDLAANGFHGVLDDGQQSTINAYSMYASEHHMEDRIIDLHRKSVESQNEAQHEMSRVISKGLSEVGAEDLTASPNYSLYIALANHKLSRFSNWNDTSGHWYLGQSAYAADFSKQDRDNMRKAKDYVGKIKGASDENTWAYVNEAVENLGLSSTKLKNLTPSDWNRINREIRELREDDW